MFSVEWLGLIKLPYKVQKTEFIRPANMPTQCERQEEQDVIAVGHGYTKNDGEVSDQLNYARLRTTKTGVCHSHYLLMTWRKSFICDDHGFEWHIAWCIQHYQKP